MSTRDTDDTDDTDGGAPELGSMDFYAAMRSPRAQRARLRYLRGKRVADVVVSGLGLVATAPVLAAIAAAVKAESPSGPVLFRQRRVGLEGEIFTILKFRTMSVDPEARRVAITATGDAEITRVGRLLRVSKLDELPQLVNVLRGEMALVGPRPEVPEFVAWWEHADRDVILSMRPGITDPASVEFRNEGDLLAAQPDPARFYIYELLPRKTARYVEYVRNASWRTDLRVIADTAIAVLRG